MKGREAMDRRQDGRDLAMLEKNGAILATKERRVFDGATSLEIDRIHSKLGDHSKPIDLLDCFRLISIIQDLVLENEQLRVRIDKALVSILRSSVPLYSCRD